MQQWASRTSWEDDFEGFLAYMGVTAISAKWPELHIKLGLNRSSGFREVIWKCYMTPIKDLWLAETSFQWLWLILISKRWAKFSQGQVDIRICQCWQTAKIDWTKLSPGQVDMTFFHRCETAKNKYWNNDWFFIYISQVKCFVFRICSFYENK